VVLAVLGVMLAAALGLAAHVVAQDTLALPAVSLQGGRPLAPEEARPRKETTTTTTTEQTTTEQETEETHTESVDDRGGSGSGFESGDDPRGHGRNRGRGGGDDD